MGIISICPRIISVIIGYSFPLEAVTHPVIHHKIEIQYYLFNASQLSWGLSPAIWAICGSNKTTTLETFQRNPAHANDAKQVTSLIDVWHIILPTVLLGCQE